MTRRAFIKLVGGAAAAWPLAAHAQQPAMPVIGFLGPLSTNEDQLRGFRQGLKQAGFVEGENVSILYRSAENAAGDPVGAGIITGLAHPGGNVTGISVQMAEQEGKRLELLKKLLPSFSRVAVLSNPSNPYCAIAVAESRRGAAALNLQFDLLEASDAPTLDSAFLTLNRIRPDAVLVVADPFLAGERVRIADEMIKNKLPSVYSYHEHVRAGGLMTYTTNYYDVFRRQGLFIDKIFKGAKPGDLPVQQPIKFELMLNLKTANALGLTIPPTLLALADEVIE